MKRLSIVILLCAVLGVIFFIARRDRREIKNDEVVTRTSVVKETAPEAPAATVAENVAVTIFGSVRSPGTFQLAKPTLVEALSRSGGPTVLADMKKVMVSRGPGGSRVKIVVDAAAIMSGAAADFTLVAGDTVFVPEAII